jgi:hypothetical protein
MRLFQGNVFRAAGSDKRSVKNVSSWARAVGERADARARMERR